MRQINIERNSGLEWRHLGVVHFINDKVVYSSGKPPAELLDIITGVKEGIAVVGETTYRWGEINCTKKEELTKTELTPVPNVGGECFTMLGGDKACPNCGSLPVEHEVRNHSLMWHDGDVYCTRCGAYVRLYDAG